MLALPPMKQNLIGWVPTESAVTEKGLMRRVEKLGADMALLIFEALLHSSVRCVYKWCVFHNRVWIHSRQLLTDGFHSLRTKWPFERMWLMELQPQVSIQPVTSTRSSFDSLTHYYPTWPGIAAHACNPITWEPSQVVHCEFNVSLSYLVIIGLKNKIIELGILLSS